MYRPIASAACGLACAAAAHAGELPARKAGLWEIKMSFIGRELRPQSMQQCVDGRTDRLLSGYFSGTSGGVCSKLDAQKVGVIYTVDSACRIGGASTTSHATITGSFDDAFTARVVSTRHGGPPAEPIQVTHTTIEARWLGPCSAGQKPGDTIVANGPSFNVLRPPARPQR
jgi:hypothetical protein